MKKPTIRGPAPGRKARLVLGQKLDRKSKPPPPLPQREQFKQRFRALK